MSVPFLFMASAWGADPVPLPDLRGHPFDGNAPVAHRVAVIGRATALGGAGLAVATFLPSLACSFGGSGVPLCAVSYIATATGAVGAVVGVGLEGVGSAIFLHRSRRAGRGPGPALGLGFVVTGAALLVAGPGGVKGVGALALVGGVVTMDIQHELVRRRSGLVEVRPMVDPVRRRVGVTGRF